LQEFQQWSEAQKLSVEIQSKLKKIQVNQASIYAQINLAKNFICQRKATNTNIPTSKEIAQELAYSIQQARKIQDRHSEAYALGVLGGVYLENQDIPNSQKLTEQALIVAQIIHVHVMNFGGLVGL
jgi:DNA-directed RNA polymerase specialized sigma subunit